MESTTQESSTESSESHSEKVVAFGKRLTGLLHTTADSNEEKELTATSTKSGTTEKDESPEAEITLNPEALKAQQNASAAAIVQRAVEFIRRQGSATERIIDILEYKALREEVRGFMLVSYELQLEKLLVVQQAAIDPQPEVQEVASEAVQGLPADEATL